MRHNELDQANSAEQNRLPHDQWEEAYLRFETPEEETRKFVRRLKYMGAGQWPRNARIVELFCGRGGGLHALDRLGFYELEGIDWSAALIAEYTGPGKVQVGDCRQLPFRDGSRDILIVQGGLHHLHVLPDDLDRVLGEAGRVLNERGLLLLVEPWRTPFLSFVHTVCRNRIIRRISPKVDALATMIDGERETYEQWLRRPELILHSLHRAFVSEREHFRWGKIYFSGRKRSS
jgi:SAM-dependent methyltransferase